MAVQSLRQAKDFMSGVSGRDRKALLMCAAALLLLVAGDLVIRHFGPPSGGKMQANRIISPLDKSLAPPAFVPSESVKVKRTPRVTVIPEKKLRHGHRSSHHHRVRAHTASTPEIERAVVDSPSSSSKPAEPPLP